MKKLFLVLLIFVSLLSFGCDLVADDINKVTDNIFDNYKELEDGAEVVGTYNQFNNINVESSYLGYGYDIINDEYIKKDYINMSAPILDMEKIESAKLKMIKENNAETIEVEGSSMEEFAEKYSVAMKIYGKVGNVFTGGLALNFNGSEHYNTYAHFYKNIINVKTFNLYLTNTLDEIKGMLSPEFENDLMNLHPEALFDKYGTHMLREVAMGGRIEVTSKYTSKTAGASASINTAVNAHMKFMKKGNFNAEEMINIEAQLEKENVECYYNVKQVGGALTNINSIDSLNEKYDQWSKSFDENPDYSALSGIVGENSLVALWDLLPVEETERRETLYQCFKDLSGESFESLCENFKINTKRTLNVLVEGTGTINDYPYQSEDGEEITLIATPDADSRFVGWYNGNELVSNNVIYSFNIHVNTNLIAKFRKLNDDSALLVVHINGNGEVTGNDEQIYKIGDSIMLTAKSSYNNEFLGWYVNNQLVSENSFYLFEITGDTTIVAKFTENEIEKCLLVVNKIGDGQGKVQYESEYYMRSVATVKAIPDEGYKFSGWYLDNELVSSNEEYSFIIEKDINIFAKFDVLFVEEYTITSNIIPSNSGIIQGVKGSFEKNELVTLSAVANEGYEFKYWLVMNEKVESNPYSIHIKDNISVSAVFEHKSKEPVELIYDINNYDTGLEASLEDSSIIIEENTVPTLAVPKSTYLVFKGWYIEGDIQISDSKGKIEHNVEGYTDEYGRWIGEGVKLLAKWERNSDYSYISNVEELKQISKAPNKNYILVRNIDLNNQEWNPIESFTGSLNGLGYTISNLKISRKGEVLNENVFLGLFKHVSGKVENLNINNVSINVESEHGGNGWIFAGSIAGSGNGIIKNCIINNANISVHRDASEIGGICGSFDGTIENCKVTNSTIFANGDNGGITGGLKDGVINGCVVEKTKITYYAVNSRHYSGGIVGFNNMGTVSNSAIFTITMMLDGSYKLKPGQGYIVGLQKGGSIHYVGKDDYCSNNLADGFKLSWKTGVIFKETHTNNNYFNGPWGCVGFLEGTVSVK